MTAAAAPQIDPQLIAGPMRDPVPFLTRLREEDPVSWLPGLDCWLVARHDDVKLLFADARVTTDPSVYERHIPSIEPDAVRWVSKMPFRSTTADTESLGRRLVSAALTPRAVKRLEDRIAEVVEQCAAPLRGREDVVELVSEFTAPISATAIARILGVPPKGDDEQRFRILARRATRSIRPFLSERRRINTQRASVEICEYVMGLLEARRAQPRDDMLSDLLRASSDAAGSTDEDIARVAAALVAAGTGTASVACARALRSLLLHPDQLALLREDRSLLPNAVNELLRYDSGLPVMPRYVREGFELRGRAFRKGQLVLLSMMGANRDPEAFPDPDRLDLRRDTSEALSFGQGPHYCIGANLARVELRMMIGAALDFLPAHARLLEDEIRWSPRGLMSQIGSLPVDFGG